MIDYSNIDYKVNMLVIIAHHNYVVSLYRDELEIIENLHNKEEELSLLAM